MEWGMVIVIAGAACLAKSLMDLVERLDHPANSTKKRPRSCGKQLRGRLHKVTTKA